MNGIQSGRRNFQDPDVTRMEFDMKDQNIRITIQNTEKAVDELKNRLIRMEEKIDKLR